MNAFASPTSGPLGWVSEGRVRLAGRCAPLRHLVVPERASAKVAVVTSVLGGDELDVAHVTPGRFEGVVVDGFGAGHTPSAMVAALEALTSRMPVVLCSRTGAGEVLSRTYGFVGSESDLLARGLISGGALDARKARVALALALDATNDARDATRLFEGIRDSAVF